MSRFRMKTPTDVRRTLQKVANMCASGELEAKKANAIIYACNSVLTAIKIEDEEKIAKDLKERIEALEKDAVFDDVF